MLLRPKALTDAPMVSPTFFGFLTESMLERQAGVVFLAFMYPLLYSLEEGKKDA